MIIKEFDNSFLVDEDQECVDNILQEYNSFIVNGLAGSGKTFRFIMPSLDKAIREERSIILTGRDLKYKNKDSGSDEELAKVDKALDKMKNAGYKIYYFNMSNPHSISPFINDVKCNFSKKEKDYMINLLISSNHYLMSSRIFKMDTWIVEQLINGALRDSIFEEEPREENSRIDLHDVLNHKVAFLVNFDLFGDNTQAIYATHLLVALYSILSVARIEGKSIYNSIILDDSKFSYPFLRSIDFDKFCTNTDINLIISSQLWIVENSLPTINIGIPQEPLVVLSGNIR